MNDSHPNGDTDKCHLTEQLKQKGYDQNSLKSTMKYQLKIISREKNLKLKMELVTKFKRTEN